MQNKFCPVCNEQHHGVGDPINGARDPTNGVLAVCHFSLIQNYAFQYVLTTTIV